MTHAVQVRALLSEARARGEEFDRAWNAAMRAISPPRTSPAAVHAQAREERRLMREVKPWWEAAYNDRLDPDPAALARAAQRTRRRLDRLGLPKESHAVWATLERIVGEAP